MIRKVKFPLRYKFVVAISILLLLTMGFYLSYALNIFKEDKAADVYSIALTNSISVAERIKLIINEETNLLNTLKESENIEAIEQKMRSIVMERDDVLGIECLVNDEHYYSAKDDRKISELTGGGQRGLDQSNGSLKLIKNASLSTTQLDTDSLSHFPPHFSLIRALNPSLKCALHVSYAKLMSLMSEKLNYETYILTDTGKVFLKFKNEASNTDYQKIVTDQTIVDVEQGVKKFENNGSPVIRAFAKISNFNLIAVTEIEERKAFMASDLLVQKSLFYGILILSIAVIVGILFTKRMTKNVQTLFEATEQMSQGNFDVSPTASGSDEIGALTDSFVEMKNKIVMFMEEMKEKARIENELKVAHLVQNSFFPKQAMVKSTFSFDGRYMPASECSGDWWGYFEQEGAVTLIACDATGHGVPAALITAAAHSCISTIKFSAQSSYVSPRAVLEKLNQVVCSMNSEILMTAFVLEINEEKKQVKYANASHMTPYLLRRENGEYTKDNIEPLIGNNGARVGEKISSTYDESLVDIKAGDRIVMFSDGLTEMEVEKKAWGQRNFLKSILKGAFRESSGMLNSILEDFNDYRKGTSLQDDVTLVAVSFEEKRSVIEEKDGPIDETSPFVISKLTNEENLDLLAKKRINHLIGHNTLDLRKEIRLVEALESKDRFHLQDYLGSEYQKKEWTLMSNFKIPSVLNEMIASFENEASPSISQEVLKLVAEELLSNAFYHSDGEGSSQKRGKEILLTPDREVDLLVADSDDNVIVSVRGPSTFSSREGLIESLCRAYKEKAPLQGEEGAGLGLYLVFEQSSQFWVVNGKNSGQVICVFEKFNRYKKAKERITSFHYLAKEISS